MNETALKNPERIRPISTDEPAMPDRRLADLKEGEAGLIAAFHTNHEITARLLERGLMVGETIRFIRSAPLGDPIEVEILNYRLALRRRVAEQIRIQPIPNTPLANQ